ncbi:hypothetical protein ANN_09351 [Periplaneta americana]|uniref:Uncharacterized protein n=1 Tax=Periplaneta americana TaxID=6978 RepID=A0ABQ8TN54_PERAM|nr:hypothetical protein ANN_09351 [Periplaneta americana]
MSCLAAVHISVVHFGSSLSSVTRTEVCFEEADLSSSLESSPPSSLASPTLPSQPLMLLTARLRWAGHVARMNEFRNAYRVLIGRPEGNRPLGRPRHKWDDNIKMDLREMGYDDRDWINVAQDRDQWRAYMRAAMNCGLDADTSAVSNSSERTRCETSIRERIYNTTDPHYDNLRTNEHWFVAQVLMSAPVKGLDRPAFCRPHAHMPNQRWTIIQPEWRYRVVSTMIPQAVMAGIHNRISLPIVAPQVHHDAGYVPSTMNFYIHLGHLQPQFYNLVIFCNDEVRSEDSPKITRNLPFVWGNHGKTQPGNQIKGVKRSDAEDSP